MINFRSPLLKAMPPEAVPDRRRLIPRRVLKFSVWFACILVPILLVWRRILPREWPFRIFYWVHDHVFLPLEGYLYTLFYPYSLTWWGPICVVSVISLVGYLLVAPPIKGLHIKVLRKVIHWRGLHPLLVRTSGWLKKWKMEPKLLLGVTALQRTIAANRLTQVPLKEPAEKAVKSLAYLTQFQIDLLLLSPRADGDLLEAAISWHQAYLQLRVRCREGGASKKLQKINDKLAHNLCRALCFLLRWDEDEEKEKFEKAKQKKPGFDPGSISVDLLYLAGLTSEKAAKRFLGPELAAHPAKIRKHVSFRLAQSTAARRALLDEARSQLEKIMSPAAMHYTDSYVNTGTNTADREEHGESKKEDIIDTLGTAGENIKYFPEIGRLSLSLALDLAALTGSPDIGLGFLESMEMLDFQLNCSIGMRSRCTAPVQLLRRAPGALDYRWCGELAHHEFNRTQQNLRHSVLMEGPIDENDVEVAQNRVLSLYRTAGPDFDLTGKGEAR